MKILFTAVLSLLVLTASAKRRQETSDDDEIDAELDEIVSSVLVAKETARELKGEGASRASRNLPSSEQKEEIVSVHNKYRRQEGASNMLEMSYSDELADMANEWAQGCNFVHGHPYRANPPWNWIGQNLYALSVPRVNMSRAILTWYTEKRSYNYATKSCKPGYVCGHYTAVVWWESFKVGCGYAICPNLLETSFTDAAYIVCNYGPGGNYKNEYPFKKGKPCSACAKGKQCNDGLCQP